MAGFDPSEQLARELPMSRFKTMASRMLAFVATHSDSPSYGRPNTLGILLREGILARGAAITYPSTGPAPTAQPTGEDANGEADAAQRPRNRG